MDDNISILEDTLKILKKGYYRLNWKKIRFKLTHEQMHEAIVWLPDDIKNISSNLITKRISADGCMESFCLNESSYTVARMIKDNHPDEKILVLNFANPLVPGGGVRQGVNAQEESLCRTSSLLLSLEDDRAKRYYEYNDALDNNVGSDAIIISPHVEIIKDSYGGFLDETVTVTVMTCAAPAVLYGFDGLSQEEYENLLYNRIMGMLKVAACYDCKYLVLGAWGCNDFGNDAEVMARIFHKVFTDIDSNGLTYDKLFKQTYFAVWDHTEDKYNFNAFYEYFGAKRVY